MRVETAGSQPALLRWLKSQCGAGLRRKLGCTMRDHAAALQSPVVASAKLRPPRLTEDLVARPRLTERLERGLTRRLTLVAAPAGFGKTTLLAAWAAAAVRPVAWLTVDESDDGRRPLLRSLTAALRTIDPVCGAATLRLLELPELPGPIHQAQILAGDLEEIGRELAIVLDDYQLLRDPSVHELIGYLLRYLP